MKTPNLFTVPKDTPTRKEKLKAFKLANGIETHDCGHKEPARWMAAHMPSCRKLGYGVTEKSDLFECVSKVCRLMDEAGYAGYGPTEVAAVREVCANLDLVCPL